MQKLLHNPAIITLLIISLVIYLIYVGFVFYLCLLPSRKTKAQTAKLSYELWLIIPALNEENVISKTITNLQHSLTYLSPLIATNILVVDDHSQDHTFSLASELTTTIKTNTELMHEGKGSVLNQATTYIKSNRLTSLNSQQVILGVLDADGYINGQVLNAVLNKFKETDSDMVQTAVAMHNITSGLTRAQNFEFMQMGRKQQLLRNRCGNAIASGNGQFVTLSLAMSNPWGNSLLEDCEFTLRSWLKGYRTNFVNLPVEQEAVASYAAFVKQRTRWCMGGMQCLKYLKAIYSLTNISLAQKMELTLTLLTPVVYIPVNLINLFAILVQVYFVLFLHYINGYLLFFILIWLIQGLLLAVEYQAYLADIKEKISLGRAFSDYCWFQYYSLITCYIPAVAIIKLLLGQTKWSKTKHG